jgi:hypothetical protein
MRSIALALVLAFGLSIQASAARVLLDPKVQPAPGPATFNVLLMPDDGEVLPGILDADLQLDFVGDLLNVSATNTGNPFFINAGRISTVCLGGEPICAIYGGSNLGGTVFPNFGDGWLLGDLTVESNGGSVEMIVHDTSRYTSSVGSISFPVSNQNGVAGTLPEPEPWWLLALGISALLLRRSTRVPTNGKQEPDGL